MVRPVFERARWLRDSDAVLVPISLAAVVGFAPFAAVIANGPPDPSETVLTLSWWLGTSALSGYGAVHTLAALADAERFLEDHGTRYAGGATVFCHALGQRLFVLVAVGLALAALAILGTGVGAPPTLLVVLGSFAATLLGPPTAIPMNRRVSERLNGYRDR